MEIRPAFQFSAKELDMQKIIANCKQNKCACDRYAVTIHKSQGATVDKTWLYASKTMDQHLMYVAGTRHKELFNIYGKQNCDQQESTIVVDDHRRANFSKKTTVDFFEKSDSGISILQKPRRVFRN